MPLQRGDLHPVHRKSAQNGMNAKSPPAGTYTCLRSNRLDDAVRSTAASPRRHFLSEAARVEICAAVRWLNRPTHATKGLQRRAARPVSAVTSTSPSTVACAARSRPKGVTMRPSHQAGRTHMSPCDRQDVEPCLQRRRRGLRETCTFHRCPEQRHACRRAASRSIAVPVCKLFVSHRLQEARGTSSSLRVTQDGAACGRVKQFDTRAK